MATGKTGAAGAVKVAATAMMAKAMAAPYCRRIAVLWGAPVLTGVRSVADVEAMLPVFANNPIARRKALAYPNPLHGNVMRNHGRDQKVHARARDQIALRINWHAG